MSDFFKSLIELLPQHCKLQDPNNQGHHVLDNTLGEFMDKHDVMEFIEQHFQENATGKYLDLFGKELNVTRLPNEADEDYYHRILCQSLVNITPKMLIEFFNIELYCKIDEYDPADNVLTSDNYYIKDYGFMAVGDDTVQKIVDEKLNIWGALDWLTL